MCLPAHHGVSLGRWCRTSFLQQGKALTLLSEIDSLVDDDSSSSRVAQLTTTAVSVPADITDNVRRLESLYVKLWFTLRYTVRFAFAIHTDVLEAGTFIQVGCNASSIPLTE